MPKPIRHKIYRFFQLLYPWVLCVLVFTYLFYQVPFQEVLETFQYLNVGLFVFLSTIYFFVLLYADCFALKYFLSRFAGEVSYQETLRVRGVSFIIAVVNYLLGQAALAYYLSKTKKASLAKSFGAISFVTLMDLMLIIVSGLSALSWSVNPAAQTLKNAAPILEYSFLSVVVILGLYGSFAFFWKRVDERRLQVWQKKKLLHWILSHDVFLIFRKANLKDYLILFLSRAPLLVFVIAHVNFALWPFQSRVPWAEVFLYNPFVLLVTSLPITPAGLGTSQYLSIEFFSSSVQGELLSTSTLSPAKLLFAASLIWYLANQVFKLLYGAYCWSMMKNKSWLIKLSKN